MDGRTPYKMLYGMKLDLVDLRAFSGLFAIVGPSEKLKQPINTTCGLWVGLQASAARVQYLCSARTELVLGSLRGLATLAHCLDF